MKYVRLIALIPATLHADITVTSRYTTGGDSTETTSYSNATRQRFDSQGAILIQQCDRKRTLEIDNESKTFSVLPAAPESGAKPPCAGLPQSMFTGETKELHGVSAKRWISKTACSPAESTEIDGWFSELQPPSGCGVQQLGPGLPMQYTLRTRDAKGVSEISYEAIAVNTAKIPPSVFEPPAGFTELDVTKAIALRDPEFKKAVAEPKGAGATRIGIANFSNRSGNAFNTRSFESKITKELKASKIETVPLGLGPENEVVDRARTAGADYVLVAELMQLSKTESGGVTKKLGKLSRLASGGGAKETYAAQLNYRLLPVNGGEAVAKSAAGNSSAFSLRDAVNLARTVSQFAMPMMMMNQMFRNGAMGSMLNNPALMNQMGGPGGMGSLDPGLGAWKSAFSSMNFAAGAVGSDPDSDQTAAINVAIEKMAKSIAVEDIRK